RGQRFQSNAGPFQSAHRCPKNGSPRVRNDVRHHDNPPRDFARLWPAPRPNKMGSQTRDPITQVLERSGRPILSRGHRLVLSYWRWFALVVFEGAVFLGPRAQWRVMLFCVFGRKPIDRGKSIRFRCCGDFRPRDNRFPRKPQNDHCDWISRRFRPAERLCADDTRVEAGQFLFGELAGLLDIVLWIGLGGWRRMRIHQQIAGGCSHYRVAAFGIKPSNVNHKYNAFPDSYYHRRLHPFRLHYASRAITVALISKTVERYLSTNSVFFCKNLIHYC